MSYLVYIEPEKIEEDVIDTTKNKDEIKGKVKQIKGTAREEVGKLTGNKTEQVKGKIEQLDGKVQETVGTVKRKMK